jgi:hypothetical protein
MRRTQESLQKAQDEMKRRLLTNRPPQVEPQPQQLPVDEYLTIRYGNKRRWVHVKRTTIEYLHKLQKGKCAICKRDICIDTVPLNEKYRRAHIDHNHTTHQIRGLLCGHCNLMLGFARENQAIFQAAIEYIRYYEEEAPLQGNLFGKFPPKKEAP